MQNVCTCLDKLSREKRSNEVLRILDSSIIISKNTSRLIIFSDGNNVTKISVNTVVYRIHKGINYLCLCRIQNISPKIEIKIASSLLTYLEKVEVYQKHSEAFILKGINHQNYCNIWKIPSLKTICYFKAFLAGYTEKLLAELTIR